MKNYYVSIILLLVAFGLIAHNYLKKGGKFSIDKMFANKKGGTPFLNSFSIDVTERAKNGKMDPVIGRQEEVLRLAQILSRRRKNNAILVGSAGVGKTAIVEGLAQRIIQKEVPQELQGKRVLSLDVAGLLSDTKYRGEFEERARKVVQEITASARSIILFIDEVHSVVQSHGVEGAVNFADILKPALARGDLQMIGATTTEEYEKYIANDSSLARRFQPLEVREPTAEETIRILQGVKDKFREYHKVEFTDAAIEAAAIISSKLIKSRKLPDKAIDAVDEAGAMVKVAHIHTDVPLILYQAAVAKHPQAASLWKQIQEVDKKLIKNKSSLLIKQRETLEKKIESLGIETVDAGDIETVIKSWGKM
ncbi:MAG: AAA family ATPase [Patescibacteria group bacterium]|mgnify:FL=1